MRSDALCARSKSLDQPVQHAQLPCCSRSRERCGGLLFDAGYKLLGNYTIAVSSGNLIFIRKELVLTRHDRNGSVYFTLQGLNGADGASISPAVDQRRWFSRRGSHSSQSHVHRSSIFSDIKQCTILSPDTYSTLTLLSPAALENANRFNETESKNLRPFKFSGKENLFNTSISCPQFTASVSLDVDSAVHAAVSLGVVAAGTYVPPKISEFDLTLGTRLA